MSELTTLTASPPGIPDGCTTPASREQPTPSATAPSSGWSTPTIARCRPGRRAASGTASSTAIGRRRTPSSGGASAARQTKRGPRNHRPLYVAQRGPDRRGACRSPRPTYRSWCGVSGRIEHQLRQEWRCALRASAQTLRRLRPQPLDSGQIPPIGRWHGARTLVASGRALDDLRTAVSRAHRALSDRARSRRDLPRAGRESARRRGPASVR